MASDGVGAVACFIQALGAGIYMKRRLVLFDDMPECRHFSRLAYVKPYLLNGELFVIDMLTIHWPCVRLANLIVCVWWSDAAGCKGMVSGGVGGAAGRMEGRWKTGYGIQSCLITGSTMALSGVVDLMRFGGRRLAVSSRCGRALLVCGKDRLRTAPHIVSSSFVSSTCNETRYERSPRSRNPEKETEASLRV